MAAQSGLDSYAPTTLLVGDCQQHLELLQKLLLAAWKLFVANEAQSANLWLMDALQLSPNYPPGASAQPSSLFIVYPELL